MSNSITDTQTIERIAYSLADKIKDCHLKCNKEAEIAILTTKTETMETKIDKMDEKLDKISAYVTKSEAEKNTVTGVIAFISGLIGIWWGSK